MLDEDMLDEVRDLDCPIDTAVLNEVFWTVTELCKDDDGLTEGAGVLDIGTFWLLSLTVMDNPKLSSLCSGAGAVEVEG